jgi:phenylacetate-CoA ligase
MLATPELIAEATQRSQLETLLPRWRTLPIYQSAPPGGFEQFPVIGKTELRRNFPANFLRPEQNLDALQADQTVELEYTSGSSEERLAVLFRRGWWNEQEARVLRLNPEIASVLNQYPQARRATLVPPVCNGLVCFSNYTSKTSRTVGSTLYVNQARIPFLLEDDELARMAEEITSWSPQFLDLDPVHGAWFALYCERRQIAFPSLKFILSSYEFESVVHRRILQRVFKIPVYNLYGSTEAGHLLLEKEPNVMKALLANVYLEIIESDENGIGQLLVTTLTNDLMPLVRYRTGDLAQRFLQPYGTHYLVHGRARDALQRPTGQRVTTWQVDQCFAGIPGFAHYSLKQSENGACHLQYIPDGPGPDAAALNQVTDQLRRLIQLNSTQTPAITTEPVQLLPPLPSGKFRLTQRV